MAGFAPAFVRRSRLIIFLAGWLLLVPGFSHAQLMEDPVENARLRVGPFGITPGVRLTNIGVDSNVFNSADNPKSDFTMTLTPDVRVGIKPLRARVAFSSELGLEYFHTFADQRSLQGGVNGRAEVPFGRVTPWFAASYSSTKRRTGFDLDLRARWVSRAISVGAEGRVRGKLDAGVAFERRVYAYDPNQLPGLNLALVLDRREEAATVYLRHRLTPLTTVVLQGAAGRDRFELSPGKNSHSARAELGVDLSPFALISGNARIGVRRFDGVGGDLLSYRGVVGSATARYTLLGRTQFEFVGQRDISYSFDVQYPYYVIGSSQVTVTPRLSQRWDVQGRFGRQRLAYKEVVGALVPQNRVDHVRQIGVGGGYHLNGVTRFGVYLDHERRTSVISSRSYAGFRVGTSVTYAQ